jgi:O-antigen/teichoic acid export membrane protein
MLTSFVLVVINMVVAPRYARLWKEGNIAQIKRLAILTTRGMIFLALPVVLTMFVLSDLIMSLFGDGFEKASLLLKIMVIGQCINVTTGSVGYLLNMSGHERDYRRVTLFSGPLTIVCSLLFTYSWGTTGAALAIAVGVSAQNLGALVMVKRRLGFWPMG